MSEILKWTRKTSGTRKIRRIGGRNGVKEGGRKEEGRKEFWRELVEQGKHYYRLKEWQESLKYFEEGLKESKGDLDCHYYMGLIEAQRGEYRRAIEHFEEVISGGRSEYIQHVYKILSYIYAQQEDYEKARRIFRMS